MGQKWGGSGLSNWGAGGLCVGCNKNIKKVRRVCVRGVVRNFSK